MYPQSSKTSRQTERALIVSFHDLGPHARAACESFLQRTERLGVSRQSLLVVPRWHDTPPFHQDPAFVEWLRGKAAAGHEICLHGYNHLSATRTCRRPFRWLAENIYLNGEAEFFQLPAHEAKHRIDTGMRILREAGFSPHGFVAPGWLLNPDTLPILGNAGFAYTTTFSAIHLLRAPGRIPAPTLVHSARSAPRRAMSLLWIPLWHRLNRGAAVLRIAVHPRDMQHGLTARSIERTISLALRNRKLLEPLAKPPATLRLTACVAGRFVS